MIKHGFTLLELLVAIFIIGLLLALLLPYLGRSRQSANDVLCQTHLRGLIQADFMYAQDNDGILAPRQLDPPNVHGTHPNPTNPATWQAHLAPYLGLSDLLTPSETTLPGNSEGPGPTMHYLDLKDAVRCDPKRVWSCPLRGPVVNDSYALNSEMGPFKNDIGIRPSPWGYRLSAVPNPSTIFVMGDVRVLPKGNRIDGVNPPDRQDPFHRWPGFRHGAAGDDSAGRALGTANFAFADGHAEPLHYNETLSKSGHWKWW